jgi:hypothetical protein
MRDDVHDMQLVERHGIGASCVPYGAGASKGRGQTSRRRVRSGSGSKCQRRLRNPFPYSCSQA